jgi:hypothetical protein
MIRLLIISLACLFMAACSGTKKVNPESTAYRPDNAELYTKIVQLDSLFFLSYNTCDINLAKYASYYSDDIEFYHDQGGIMTSKQEIVDATKRNICGKVTRELVKGSIEVYPIKGFGAVEFGYHKFHNNQVPITALPRPDDL